MSSIATVAAVQDHYDRLSTMYDLWWGEHLHHGYWESDGDSSQAQVKLVEVLASEARISRDSKVLDVGCGLGGSAVWLARNLGCRVHGITISPVQARLAASRAVAAGLESTVNFEVMDAQRPGFPATDFDAVWTIECLEHLKEKQAFFENAARLLRPGGKLAVCAWLAADEPDARQAELLRHVCDGMVCPSLASMNDHLRWIRGAGFNAITGHDLTNQVKRTWDRCEAIVRRPELQVFLKATKRSVRDFVNAFPLMRQAYETGAMRSGMFTGRMPG